MTRRDTPARRTYPAQAVYAVACGLLAVNPHQVAARDKTPPWLPMARQAICGAVYELGRISFPQLARLIGCGPSHSGVQDHVNRFRHRWPRHMRRAWLEAVMTRLDP